MRTYTLTDGIYEASACGFLGQVPVRVTVQDGKVADIAILPNDETGDFIHKPSITIPRAVKQHQSLDVDLVTGATFSSRAILEAITDCVRQAGGSCGEARGEGEVTAGEEQPAARWRGPGAALGTPVPDLSVPADTTLLGGVREAAAQLARMALT